MLTSKYFHLVAQTNIGHREINQDCYTCCEEPFANSVCIMVADGLGGHSGSEIASQALLEHIQKLLPAYVTFFNQDPMAATEGLVQEACHALRQTLRQKYEGLDAHTTLALVWIDQEKWVSCHVGDSRIYLIENNKIVWRTQDHSPVEKLYLEGEISETVMYKHPMQNILLRTINAQIAPELEITLHPKLEKNQSIIACTDGFWGNLNHFELVSLVRNNLLGSNLANAFDQLLKTQPVLDNLTAVILQNN